ncbi:MAG: hypothetical protein ACYTHM_02335 [Planctomycetota bacterium]|jgi:hypothetical protein
MIFGTTSGVDEDRTPPQNGFPQESPLPGPEGGAEEWEERGHAEGYRYGEATGTGEGVYAAEGQPSGKATAAMVLGIIGVATSLCCCGMGMIGLACSILAWILGHQETRAIEAGTSAWEGLGQAKAGMILGIIGTIFNTLLLIGAALYYLTVFVFMIAGSAASA